MTWKSRRQKEQDKASTDRLILFTMFICLIGVLYGLANLELSQRMTDQRAEAVKSRAEEAAMVQLRWEAKVRAKAWPGVHP